LPLATSLGLLSNVLRRNRPFFIRPISTGWAATAKDRNGGAPWKGDVFQWVKGPPGNSLQPEAAGAVMEVTKWLKPSECGSRISDRASVQAVTRVNAEQASKRTMCRPTRQPFRGRLTRLDARAKTTSRRCTGVVAAACTQGKRTQHGKPHGVVRDDQPDTREGSAGRHGVGGEVRSTAESG
jgi:hypothetical protein